MRLAKCLLLLACLSCAHVIAGELDDDRAYLDKHLTSEEKAKWAAEKEAQAKADAEAAAHAADLAEQQKIADLLKQIRDNQDAANPNPPTRY